MLYDVEGEMEGGGVNLEVDGEKRGGGVEGRGGDGRRWRRGLGSREEEEVEEWLRGRWEEEEQRLGVDGRRWRSDRWEEEEER